jgi:hypothetical protein
MQRAQDQQPTHDLDVYLAFAPWRDVAAAKAYAELIERGRVPAAPYYLLGAPAGDRDYSQADNVRRRLRELADRFNTDAPLFGEDHDG